MAAMGPGKKGRDGQKEECAEQMKKETILGRQRIAKGVSNLPSAKKKGKWRRNGREKEIRLGKDLLRGSEGKPFRKGNTHHGFGGRISQIEGEGKKETKMLARRKGMGASLLDGRS